MKKQITMALTLLLLCVAMAIFCAPVATACSMGAGEDYVYVDGENLRNVTMPLSFTDKLVYGDSVAPVETLGTTKEYNLCPPQDGVTVLVFFRNDCHYYRDARRFFQSLSLATWVDDPRIRIVAVDCTDWNNGGYPMSTYAFAQKYAYGCYQSVEWYNALGPGFHYISWLSRFENYGIGEAYVAVLSHSETTDFYGNTVPAYCVDYVGSNKALQSTAMLENTLSYIFPDLEQAVGQYTPPQNQTWTVGVVGDRDYAAAQQIYEKNVTQRDNYWVDKKQPMILDEELTELAMQRAAEIAIHFDHQRPDGREMKTIFSDMRYQQTDPYYAENISFTTVVDDLSTPEDESANDVYQGWVNSSGHFNNMMWGGGKVGVGCFRVGDRSFWVQIYDGSACTTGTPLTRTDTVEVVTNVRTATDKLNVKVKRSLYGEIDQPTGYMITHEGGDIAYRYSLQLAVHSYDATVKTLGSTIATVQKDGANLTITLKKQGSGIMNIKLAPEQADTIEVKVTGKTTHTHAYTIWGLWERPDCYDEGCNRRYCSCGHYEEVVLPIVHVWEERPEIPATCQKTGTTSYIRCKACFLQKNEPQEIPALGHKPVVEIAGRAPTCSKYGLTEKLRCSVCDMVTQQQEAISRLPHTEVVIPAVAATCAKGGYTEGKKCSVCNTQTVVPLPTEALDHVWKTLPGKPATCKATGLTEGLGCTGCGEIYTKQEKIPKTSHRIVAIPGTPATCKAPGHTDGSKCGDCGKVMYEGTIIPQRAHNYQKVKGKAATCKATGLTDGTKCSMCGRVGTRQKTIAKKAHTYKVTATKKATLTANGTAKKVCSGCGYTASTKTTLYKASKITLSATAYTYNGKVKKPTVTVKDAKGKTISSSNYTVTYAGGRKNVGTYKVTVKFKGNYSGTKTLTFTVKPPTTTVSKLTAAKKSFKVTVTKKTAQVTGYQIQYATAKSFSGAKTKTITNYKTTAATVKSLSAKKTYYVRVRTYKTVNGKKIYSGWSGVKTVKTK